MGQEITQIHKFVRDPDYGLKKGVMVIRTDAGNIYEFEKAVDAPKARLVRGFKPDGTLTHVGAHRRLPAAVEETARDILGVFDK